ncbi:hypothetical protein Ppa06_07370 [Planomonospora parontospora subsp. parontospora]|uniref:PIN domain-containing protein n=2 Tax=Planomonospora parontospora TaxID=58119 RepID=A0AA37BCV5_9ACTN|nr:PIN domain-containing protein [Planomonospora parontospora]GGK51925.1 hypothetical protein GCM10010126_09240 [Planomonospora parontospora]GII06939.1 hypothetical protein Ppa06_07370 [Planomonospora parontospora subsp. parontospora]
MTIAILDANVLIPNALCDLLLRLAEENLLQPRWSPHILTEVQRHLPSADPKVLSRRVDAMNAAFESAMVTGYERLIAEMTNHPKDRHVLAAAVHADADLIITCNLRDFPDESCDLHGIEVQHPDDFLLDLLDREPGTIDQVIREQSAATGRSGPKLTPLDVMHYLAAAGAKRFSASLVARFEHDWNQQVESEG